MASGATVKLGVEGISQFKTNMNQAKAAVKTLDAQLTLTEKQFKATGDSESYMTEKAELLKAKLEQQKTAIKDHFLHGQTTIKNGTAVAVFYGGSLTIPIEDDDLKQVAKEAARAQFAQYGMSNVPDEYLDNYAQEMLKKRENVDGLVDRAVDVKLTAALKGVVKLDEKDITLEDFQKMLQEK